ncbi:MAG: porin [Paludibacter sp.]|nr:porin [Paludibacter sp.]
MKVKKSLILSAGLFLTLCQNIKAELKIERKDSIKQIAAVVPYLPKISGYINARFQSTSPTFVTGKNGFEVKNAIVDIIGNATKTINYRLRFELAGSPQVLDAYAEWKPLKYIGLQVGQFQVPYTFENQYVPKTLETAENSQIISNLISATNGVKNKGRDIGISINGSVFQKTGYNLIDYKVAAFNGNTFNTVDDNSTIDVLGSVYINPIKPLSFAASYLTGKYGPEATKTEKSRAAVGLKYDDGKALFRGEYITGRTNNIDAAGYYAMAGYFVTKNIQPILKYDFLETNKSIATTGNTQYLIGLNYWLPNKSRILLDYTYNTSKNPAIASTGNITAGLIVAF